MCEPMGGQSIARGGMETSEVAAVTARPLPMTLPNQTL